MLCNFNYTYLELKTWSVGAGGSKLPVFRDDNDVYVLHCGHYDVGRCDILNTRLGYNGNGNVHSISTILWIYFGAARITAMVARQRAIGGGA